MRKSLWLLHNVARGGWLPWEGQVLLGLTLLSSIIHAIPSSFMSRSAEFLLQYGITAVILFVPSWRCGVLRKCAMMSRANFRRSGGREAWGVDGD